MTYKKKRKTTKKKVDKAFVKEGIEHISKSDFDTVFDKKDQLFAKINHPDWKKYKDKIKLMFNFLKDVKQKNYTKTPWKALAAMIFVIIYIINPLDLVPDFIPFIGYIDDVAVFSFVLKMVGEDLEDYKAWKDTDALEV